MYKITTFKTEFGFRTILDNDFREFWAPCPCFDAKTEKQSRLKAIRFADKVGINVY